MITANIFLTYQFQFMAATRNGLFGLTVVSLVVQERKTVIVSAQILGQHTEDEGVAALDHVKNCGLVTFSGAQVQVSCKKSTVLLSLFLCVISY